MLPSLQLKKNEDLRIKEGHVWIYSNEIDTAKTPLKSFEAGSEVIVYDFKGKALGLAYVNPHSLIAGRLLSTNPAEQMDLAFFTKRLTKALALRQQWYGAPFYRWVFGESDGLPGLVIDRYQDYVVVQLNTAGMERHKAIIVEAITALCQPSGILIRADSSMRVLEQLPSYVEVAFGTVPDELILEENGVKFAVPLLKGQKTGWFYDQRDNRALVQRFVKAKTVLDAFSYVGSFGIQAAVAGATAVQCIDASALAIDYVNRNAALNKVASVVHGEVGDAFDIMRAYKEQGRQFDVVIIDPPAFIKKRKDFNAGGQAYRRLNELALNLLAPGGLLVTCSCSLHLPEAELIHCVQMGLAKTQRHGRLIFRGQQSFDHPIHPSIPESSYLKSLFFQVD